ncbi:MAG: TonB-dependent receptor, partial [Pseudomonadota bacterium]
MRYLHESIQSIRALSLGLVPLTIALFQPALANHGNDLSVDYFFEELPEVLSATRLAQPLSDIPAALTVIDKEMIRASGALNIPDLLRLVPGMTLGFYSGSRATASYHGMADQYARDMQVLIDGRSVYDPGYGGVSWPDMPIELDEVARIEVIRGPNAAAYGSNAYAGVINIITDHPADNPGATLKTILGEGKTRKLYGRQADADGDFAYRLSASYQEYGGFDSIPDDEHTGWLSFHGDYSLDERNQFQAILGYSEGSYDEGYNEVAQNVRELENRYHFQQLNWQHRVDSGNEVKVQLYHNFFEIDDDYQSPVLSEVIRDWYGVEPDLLAQVLSGGNYAEYVEFLAALNMTDSPLAVSILGFKSHRYDLEMEQTLAPLDNLRLVWGLGLRQDSVQGVWIFHQDEKITRDQGRIFGNLEWHFQANLLANIGIMLERFEKKDPFYSPRLALNYHLDSSNTLRVSASRAYRMPTLYEDYVNQVVFLNGPLDDLNTRTIATENLDPQCIDSYELGYLGSFPESGITLDLRLFREKLTDIIDITRNWDLPNPDRGLTDPIALAVLEEFNNIMHRGAFTYTNEADANIKGVELNLHFKPTPADLVFVGYSYIDAEGTQLRRIEDGVYYYEDDLGDNVPDHTFSLLGSHRFEGGFQISSAYYFMGAMNWPGEGDEVPSYNRWDLRFAQDIQSSGLDGEISLFLQNLNRDNIDFYEDESTGQINVWKRRVFLQAV